MAAWHTDVDLFHQWEEAEDRAEKWDQTCRQRRQQHNHTFYGRAKKD